MGLFNKKSTLELEALKQELETLKIEEHSSILMIQKLEEELRDEQEKTNLINQAIVAARLDAQNIEKDAKTKANLLLDQRKDEMIDRLQKFEERFNQLSVLGNLLINERQQLVRQLDAVLSQFRLSLEEIGVPEGKRSEPMEMPIQNSKGIVINFPSLEEKDEKQQTPVYVFSNN